MDDNDVLHTWFIFNLHTKILFVFTRHASWYLHNVQAFFHKNPPASIKNPRFTYLEGQLLALGDEIPIHPGPQSGNKLSHPTVHITLFT
jgi:hypothetical protein